MKKIALITGASSGLGKEFVRQLDHNKEVEEFYVVARREERLLELQKYTDKPVVALPFDLTDVESILRLEKILHEQDIDIRVLVVAAGLGKVGKTSEISLRDTNRMIDLNVRAAVDTTLIALPFMHKGARIIEIASIAGMNPMPYFNVYSASKAFLITFSKALRYELKNDGIKVTCLCPYWVKDTEFIAGATKNNKTRYASYPLATYKKRVVRRALFDSKFNKTLSTPGVVVSLTNVLSKLVPDAIILRIMDEFSKR